MPKFLQFSLSFKFSHQTLCALLFSPIHNITGTVTRQRPWLLRNRV